MPNHFTVVAICGRDWKRLEEAGKEDFDLEPLNGANLCEIIAPLPEDLVGIVSTTPLCKWRHKTTGEWCRDSDGPHWQSIAEWECVNLTDEQVAELREKHNATNWYEWQPENWGTKWGIYSLEVHELGGDGSPVLIEFQCAWGPPNAVMMRKIDDYLCETYFLKGLRWMGHDPYDGQTCEIEIAPCGVEATQ